MFSKTSHQARQRGTELFSVKNESQQVKEIVDKAKGETRDGDSLLPTFAYLHFPSCPREQPVFFRRKNQSQAIFKGEMCGRQ